MSVWKTGLAILGSALIAGPAFAQSDAGSADTTGTGAGATMGGADAGTHATKKKSKKAKKAKKAKSDTSSTTSGSTGK